jgi:predicted RNA binding protein YcfA (HicA-like mRNA interferase family)
VSRARRREAYLLSHPKDWRLRDARWLLEHHGFVQRSAGRHQIVYKHPVSGLVVPVPDHPGLIHVRIVRDIIADVAQSDILVILREA